MDPGVSKLLPRFLPLSAWPSLIGATLVLALIWLSTAYHLHQTRRGDLAQGRRNVTNMAVALAEQVSRLVEGTDQVLRYMQEDFARDPQNFDLGAWAGRSGSLNDVTNRIALFDEKGDLVASAQMRPVAGNKVNVADRASFTYLKSHPGSGLFIGRTLPGRIDRRLVFPLGRRLADAANTFRGVIYVSLDPQRLTEEFKTLDVGIDGSVALFGLDGLVRARSPVIDGMYDLDVRGIDSRGVIFKKLELSRSGVYELPSAFDKKVRIYGYRAVAGLPLVISVGLSLDEVLAPYRTERLRVVLFGGFSTAVVALLLAVLLREQKRRESHRLALAASETRYRLLADNTTDMITHMDLTGRRRFVSPASRDLLGYIAEELVGTSPHQMIHPDDAPRLAAIFADFAAGRIDRVINVNRLRHRDGHWIWIEASLKLLRHSDGTPSSVVGVMRNVTERRRAESAVKASESRFRLLAENTSELIILAKDDGTRTYISPASYRLFGYTSDELADEMKHFRWVHPDEREQLAEASLGDSGTTSVVCRVGHKEGGWIWVEAIIRRFVGAGGDEPSIIATFRDVSERQAQAEALRQAKIAAEQASQAKTEFLAAMSHEIRTPLNAVLGYADLLLADMSVAGEKRLSLERIQNAGSALRTVVDDILDFSKIEAGEIDLVLKPFRPGLLVDNAISIVRGSAQAKTLALVIDIGANVPQLVVGDHDRLRQVLLNLLNNAIKFTLSGSVTLLIRALTSESDFVRLRFGVEDTGIGIVSDKLERLFQRFSQIDGSISRDFGGTGLGLAICRRLVEAMNGVVGVTSEFGRGSTFWFDVTLPVVKAVAQPATVDEGSSDHRPATLLLVEDQELNRDLARAVLEKAGHIVVSVNNGAAAVDAVKARTYDVVLMDVQMPIMDGIEATRRIRNLGDPFCRVPILAMTANVLPSQVAELFAAGMNGHIGKPFRQRDLLNAVAHHGRAAVFSSLSNDSQSDRLPLDVDAFLRLSSIMGSEKLDAMLSSVMAEVAAITALDRRSCATRAHAALSAAGMLGLTDLSSTLRQLESACLSAISTSAAIEATVVSLSRAARAVEEFRAGRRLTAAA